MRIPNFSPVTKARDDQLGYSNAAKKLAVIIDSLETPNCFGIYGVWGGGKTSLMQLLMEELNENCKKTQTIWFDAWKYEYVDNVPITFHLLNDIQKSVKKAGDLKTLIADFKKFSGDLGLCLSKITIDGLLSFLSKSAGTKQMDLDYIRKNVRSLYTEYENWASDSVSNFKDEFEKGLQKALKEAGKEKMVIFIDDMDRCLPENSIRLLEAIKNYLNVKNTIFIIGVDRRVIIDHINNKYSGAICGYGEEYLNKIIPLSITLPDRDVRKIIDSILGSFEEQILTDEEKNLVIDYFNEFCRNNRRMIFVVFYQFLMTLLYVNLDELLNLMKQVNKNNFQTKKQCKIGLFRWCLIQELEPRLLDYPDWTVKLRNILSKDKEENNVLNRLCEAKKIRRATTAPAGVEVIGNPLTATIQVGEAHVLNKFINENLFE